MQNITEKLWLVAALVMGVALSIRWNELTNNEKIIFIGAAAFAAFMYGFRRNLRKQQENRHK